MQIKTQVGSVLLYPKSAKPPVRLVYMPSMGNKYTQVGNILLTDAPYKVVFKLDHSFDEQVSICCKIALEYIHNQIDNNETQF